MLRLWSFIQYLMGTFYNSSATAGFSNITACTSREDIVLSMFQGICISMCIEIQKLEKRVQHFEQIYMVGGGSKSNIWGQMFADVLDRPIHICRAGVRWDAAEQLYVLESHLERCLLIDLSRCQRFGKRIIHDENTQKSIKSN